MLIPDEEELSRFPTPLCRRRRDAAFTAAVVCPSLSKDVAPPLTFAFDGKALSFLARLAAADSTDRQTTVPPRALVALRLPTGFLGLTWEYSTEIS